jgi:hypothetical protein
MQRALGLFAATMLFLAGSALAGEKAPTCATIDAVLDSVPGDVRAELLTSPARERAGRLFNALPPESEGSYDVVIWAEGQGVVVLFLGSGKEICARWIFAPAELELVRLAIFGPSA